MRCVATALDVKSAEIMTYHVDREIGCDALRRYCAFKANTRNALRLRAWWEGQKAAAAKAQEQGPGAKR